MKCLLMKSSILIFLQFIVSSCCSIFESNMLKCCICYKLRVLQSLHSVLYIVIAGNSFVKSPASNAQSNCSSEWLSIKSQKSGSSSSKSGEKVNVRTTHPQLVWGSVAVGKSVTKSFAVRSEDSCKLAVYVYVEDKLHSYEVSFTLKKLKYVLVIPYSFTLY